MTSDLRFYGRLIIRRAPAMVVLFLICAVVGWVLALRMPTLYTSTARILVEPPQIEDEALAGLAPIEAMELSRQRLMRRANLLEIASDHDVFEDLSQIEPDTVLDMMIANTEILLEGGESRRTGPLPALMTVNFTARSGEIAADVVNDYVTRLTQSNTETREDIVSERLAFFEQQVERLNRQLDDRSTAISLFQRENADALPEDQEFRLQRQSLLQERIAAAEREQRALVSNRDRMIEVFRQTGMVDNAGTALTPDQQALQAAQDELDRLLLNFSETAPQVQQVRRRIAQLEERIAAQAPAPEESESADSDVITDPNLAVLLADIETRMEALDVEISAAEAELLRLDEAITQAPLNGVALAELERNYDNIRLQYDRAVQRLANAAAGETIETGGRGQRFTLIEPPVVPNSPTSPNRLMIAGAGIAMGLVLAGGLFVLLEILNSTIRRPKELVRSLNITPLATIPYIESAGKRFRRRAMRLAAIAVVIIGLPAILWSIDQYYQPLDVLASWVLERLGIA